MKWARLTKLQTKYTPGGFDSVSMVYTFKPCRSSEKSLSLRDVQRSNEVQICPTTQENKVHSPSKEFQILLASISSQWILVGWLAIFGPDRCGIKHHKKT